MSNWLLDHIGAILTAAGALALVIIAPLSTKLMERMFARRPAFTIRSPVLDQSLMLTVEAANKTARKKRPLGVNVRGLILLGTTMPRIENGSYIWDVDLSKVEGLDEILKPGEDYEFQFFFDPNQQADKILIRFSAGKKILNRKKYNEKLSFSAKDTTDFLSKIQSDSIINILFSKQIANSAFPMTTSHAEWQSVHDGKELHLTDLNNIEIRGREDGTTAIVVEPRYSWVVNFRNCHSLALRNITFGHTEAGYCRGGVLRFESCSNISLEKCVLFGCGTYGIELVDCTDIEISNTTIRNCTYGIAIFNGVSNMTIRECLFTDNQGFDMVQLLGNIDACMFRSCQFTKNDAHGSMIKFPDTGESSDIYLNDCTFENNKYFSFTTSDEESKWLQYDNVFHGNKITNKSWFGKKR